MVKRYWLLMQLLSLFWNIVYISEMWIKSSVTSGTTIPPGRLWGTVADTGQVSFDGHCREAWFLSRGRSCGEERRGKISKGYLGYF